MNPATRLTTFFHAQISQGVDLETAFAKTWDDPAFRACYRRAGENKSHAFAYASRIWEQCLAYRARHPWSYREQIEAAGSLVIPGGDGPVGMACWTAHCYVAWMAGRASGYTATVRYLARLAQVSKQTIGTWTGRFVRAGLIKYPDPEDRSRFQMILSEGRAGRGLPNPLPDWIRTVLSLSLLLSPYGSVDSANEFRDSTVLIQSGRLPESPLERSARVIAESLGLLGPYEREGQYFSRRGPVWLVPLLPVPLSPVHPLFRIFAGKLPWAVWLRLSESEPRAFPGDYRTTRALKQLETRGMAKFIGGQWRRLPHDLDALQLLLGTDRSRPRPVGDGSALVSKKTRELMDKYERLRRHLKKLKES